MQELSITLTSELPNNQVMLVDNKQDVSAIFTGIFLNEQEWELFDYVKSTPKETYDTFRQYNRSCFTVTAFIARKPGYYIYK